MKNLPTLSKLDRKPTRFNNLKIKPLTILIFALLIATIASIGIDMLHSFSGSKRDAVELLREIEGLSHRLSALEWKIAATQTFSPENEEEIFQVQQEFSQAVMQLSEKQTGVTTETFIEASVQYGKAIESLVKFYRLGKLHEAQEWDENEVDSSYTRLLEASSGAGVTYQLEASYADTFARISSFVILILSAILISYLVRRFQHAQRDVDYLTLKQQLVITNQKRYQSLISNALDIIVVCDVNGRMEEPSNATEEVLGCAPATLIGKKFHHLVHPSQQIDIQNLFQSAIYKPRANVYSEFKLQHTDGSWRICEIVLNNLLDDSNVAGIVVTCHHITERKKLEDKLSHLAFYDTLTHLPNRTFFISKLQVALEIVAQTTNKVAVLFLDLDNFKVINDSLGHQTGDQLLVAVAHRLTASISAQESIARFGGDEFTILIEEVSDIAEVTNIAEEIHKSLNLPFYVDGHELYITTSIGISISNDGANELNDLLRDADLAMYHAKTNGKANFAIFDRSLSDSVQERLEIETDLRRALERNELRIYYQPVLNLGTTKICEMEALIRWMHPKRGLISPASFIQIAEETGLILPIGRWILLEACRQMVQWQTEYPSQSPLVMNVNLSSRQFQDPDLANSVEQCLQETGLPSRCLKLEITESMMMQDSENTAMILAKLKSLGVQLAIDDFGTGYCSLNYLKRFPVDTLKIDRSFVAGLGHNSEDTAIVRAIVTFAKELALNVTGEGIETQDQLAQLVALDCEQGQGYLFSIPLPSETATELLANGQNVTRLPAHPYANGSSQVLQPTDILLDQQQLMSFVSTP